MENIDTNNTVTCSKNTGNKHIQSENFRSPILISDTFFLILPSLTGGPAGKGGGQKDKNDGGALNFDSGYNKKIEWCK